MSAPSATETLKQYEPLVISIAKRFVSKDLSLDELVEAGREGLLEAWRTRRRCNGVSFATWARRPIYWAIYDYVRSVRARQYCELLLSHESPSTNPHPRDVFALDRLRRSFLRLPKLWRRVLTLIYADGMTYTEAAEVLGCSQPRVTKIAVDARERLRKRLIGIGHANE